MEVLWVVVPGFVGWIGLVYWMLNRKPQIQPKLQPVEKTNKSNTLIDNTIVIIFLLAVVAGLIWLASLMGR